MPGSSSSLSNGSEGAHLRDSSQYQVINIIGNGAYGTVYKARDQANDGQFVAMKKVRVPLGEDGVPACTLREISLLKQLERFEHPNIVRLLDVCHGTHNEHEQHLVLYLVFEHVEQDLAAYLDRCPSPGLCPSDIKQIVFQMLSGVDFLHSHRIVHRDLKPQNVLITNNKTVKLADFGLAKIYDFSMRLTSVVVTLWYRAPEVLLNAPYATPVDVWACGCIFAELFRRNPLFPGQSEGDQLSKIFTVVGCPPESKWPKNVSVPWRSFSSYRSRALEEVVPEICKQGKDLLEKMLRFDPNERITAAESKQHPYFRLDGFASLRANNSWCGPDDLNNPVEGLPDK